MWDLISLIRKIFDGIRTGGLVLLSLVGTSDFQFIAFQKPNQNLKSYNLILFEDILDYLNKLWIPTSYLTIQQRAKAGIDLLKFGKHFINI